jgi:hypothetical protein
MWMIERVNVLQIYSKFRFISVGLVIIIGRLLIALDAARIWKPRQSWFSPIGASGPGSASGSAIFS